MKIIICFFGVVPRSIQWTYPSINERILKPLKIKHNVDIYVFNMNVGSVKVDGVKMDQEKCKIISFDFFEEIDQEIVDEEINEYYSGRKCEMSYGGIDDRATINSIRTMYSEYMVSLFLEKNIGKYDVAIALSPDFYFHEPINLKDVENCSNGKIFTTTNHDSENGYTDGFYIGKPNDLSLVMKRYIYKDRYISNENNYERILKKSFLENNIERVITCLEFCKIRANKKIWGKYKISRKDPLKPFDN